MRLVCRRAVVVGLPNTIVYVAVAPLPQSYSGTGDLTLGYTQGTLCFL